MADIVINDVFNIYKYYAELSDWHSDSPRKHHYLALQKEGCVVHTLPDGRELVASPGTVLFLNGKDSYDAHVMEWGYSIVACLELESAPESFLMDFSGDSAMINLFTIMLSCRNNVLASNRYIALGTLYEVFGRIKKREEAAYMTQAQEGRLHKVRMFIQEHYGDPELNMDKIAETAGLSARYLNMLFNQKFGVSCWQYAINTRIDAATRLLRMQGYSVGKIAEECGFRDAYYFSRLFKKYMKFSPQKYRSLEFGIQEDKE